MIKKVSLLFVFIFSVLTLTACSQSQALKWQVAGFSGDDYEAASVDEPHAKVIMIGEGFNTYLFFHYLPEPDRPHYSMKIRHEFPSEKQDFSIPINSDFNGETLYSFNMKIEEHKLDLRGYNTIPFLGTKVCNIESIAFTPKENKNYIFYFHRLGEDKCILDVKEAVYKNGQYLFVNLTNELKEYEYVYSY